MNRFCQAISRRRLLRLSLRTSFLVVTILCVAFWYLHRVERQRDAVRWIIEHEGMVEYDYQWDAHARSEFLPSHQPPAAGWIGRMLGDDFVSDIVFVTLDRSHPDSKEFESLAPLASLPEIRHLVLSYSNVEDIKPLAGLKKLEYLDLDNTPVTDLTPLASLSNLRHLSINNSNCSDLTPLAGLRRLEYLDLAWTKVDNLEPLSNMLYLENLRLTNTFVDDAQLKKLRKALPKLN